jgi:sugar phosphate isomerase/epimerase
MGKDRLQALHVHDVDYVSDCHTMPFMESLDWNAVAAALAQIRYEGNFTFEADNFLIKMPRELMPEASRLMAQTGRYLIGRIEALQRA